MTLASELADDSLGLGLGRGYSTMSDQEVADDLNLAYRTRDRQTMTASEIANAIDLAEFAALSDTEEAEIWNWLHLDTLNPFGIEATRFAAIFGAGSATITALKAARVEAISRAVELGLGTVKSRNVGYARAE